MTTMDVDHHHHQQQKKKNNNGSSSDKEDKDDEGGRRRRFELSNSYTFGETGIRVGGMVTLSTLVLGDQYGQCASFAVTSTTTTATTATATTATTTKTSVNTMMMEEEEEEEEEGDGDGVRVRVLRPNTSRMTILPTQHHNHHAVTALLPHPNQSLYVTGCKDNVIRIFHSNTNELVKELHGHDKPVTSLAWVTTTATTATTMNHPCNYYLISGSWDGTARIWNIMMDNRSAMVACLSNHENSVCVVGLDSTTGASASASATTVRVATGSAGIAASGSIRQHSLRLWTVDVQSGQVQLDHHIVEDHDGPIRGLCTYYYYDDDDDDDDSSSDLSQQQQYLASCSNDGTVKVRDSRTGHVLSTLSFVQDDDDQQQQQQQHPPMLLSVTSVHDACTNETILVAGAEDGHVIVWNLTNPSQSPPQVILHPACVWNVVPMPNGDFGTCCQDGTFYVFTRCEARYADAIARAAWTESVQLSKRKLQSGPSPEDIAKLPHWHQRSNVRGRSEGQVQLFQNEDGIAIAAQWSAASQTWIEVGQVVGNTTSVGGDSERGMVDGVHYDHVLPIQVDTANNGTVNLQIGYNNGENPFVAAQRFIDAHVLPQYHLGDIADYISQRIGSVASHTLGSASFPSSSSSSGPATAGSMPLTATTGVPLASYVHLPAKAYKTFELSAKTATTTTGKMESKLESYQLLSNEQLTTLHQLINALVSTNRYDETSISDSELQLIPYMMEQFPLGQSFPAIDLARMVVLHPSATTVERTNFWCQVMQLLSTLNARTTTKYSDDAMEGLDITAQVAIPMLSLRVLANAFQGGPGSLQAVSTRLDDLVVTLLQAHVSSTNKNIRLSVATLLHNVCLYLSTTPSSLSLSSATLITNILTLSRDVLSNRQYEGEAIYRTLIAVGTLVMGTATAANAHGTMAKDIAQNLFLASKVEMAASPHGPAVKAAAKEVYTVLA